MLGYNIAMGKCNYEYMAGKKKNTLCNRFIRKKDETLCWAHRPKVVEPVDIEKPEKLNINKPIKDIKPKFEKKVEKSPIKKRKEIIPGPVKEESAESEYTISHSSEDQPIQMKKAKVIQLKCDSKSSESSSFSIACLHRIFRV